MASQAINRDGTPPRTTVHLHGGVTPAVYDGHPNAYIEPRDSFDYVYPDLGEATTFWTTRTAT